MCPLHRSSHPNNHVDELNVNPLYATMGLDGVPRHRIPDNPMPADTALAIIRDELILDGNARQNLATFCTTWMEPQAGQLIADCLAKNMIDKDEYPQTAELERRCINILAHLWHATAPEATGCSTTGSSEAVMLGGMALKWRWRARRRAGDIAGEVVDPAVSPIRQQENTDRAHAADEDAAQWRVVVTADRVQQCAGRPEQIPDNQDERQCHTDGADRPAQEQVGVDKTAAPSRHHAHGRPPFPEDLH